MIPRFLKVLLTVHNITEPNGSNLEALAQFQMPSLLDLPNELLLQIISNVDLYREERILGHDPDRLTSRLEGHSLIDEFNASCRTLRSLALTCRRMSPLVAEQIIFAPLITNWKYPVLFERPPLIQNCTRLFALISELVAYPERTSFVKQMRLSLCSEADFDQDKNASKMVSLRTHTLLESLELPSSSKLALRELAHESPSNTLVSILLMLVSRLETLCISRPMGFNVDTEVERPCCLLKKLPFHTLEYLKFENHRLIDLDHLSCCADTKTLDLSLCPGENISDDFTTFAASPASSSFPRRSSNRYLSELHHLRLDFQTNTVGVWNHGKRIYMVDLLQRFRYLRSLDFYAEPSKGKNPFRSVRAFPHYQANIQNYPDKLDCLPLNIQDQYWDQRLYNARTEMTDYQSLVDSIVHLRPTLEALRLPGGFWTLPGGMRKPLPRFDKFMRLTKLVVPQAAIISIRLDNMRLDDVAGDFVLSPKMALPPIVQHLEIFDVDAMFLYSQWLLDFFGAQLARRQWPAFEILVIRVGYTVEDEELEKLIARRSPSHRTFCTLAQTAPFSIVVRRDDDVPALSVSDMNISP